MKKNKYKILIISALAILLSTGFVLSRGDVFFDIAKNIDIFTKVYKEVAFGYVDEINSEEFMRAGIKGMLSTLDPYTVFIDEKKQEDIELITNGKYGGIGVTIGIRDDKVTLVEILHGYSAQKQGLQIGDFLMEVNGFKITPRNIDEVSSLVKGEPGTFVNLKILRPGNKDTLHFELLREEIKLKNVSYYGFYPKESGIAYIKLISFSRSAGEEVKNAILELKKKHSIDGLVLDLRNNPGGLLDVAVDIANKFLNKGQLVVSTRGKDSANFKQYFCTQEPLLKNTPLVVLVNEGSASASEIVAGAIQDHDRGIILGQKSFGKGLVQTIVPLSHNTSLKITTSKYFTPSGRCIQKIDYAKESKVIASIEQKNTLLFNTDNNRQVFAAGGITPDTLVLDKEDPEVVLDMLAKGMFFKFTNYLLESKQVPSLESITDKELIKLFTEYLISEKYGYVSPEEKRVDELLEMAKKHKHYADISNKISAIKADFKSTMTHDITQNMGDVLTEIKIEIESRARGSEGRLVMSLKEDDQFLKALSLVQNENGYKNLIRKR